MTTSHPDDLSTAAVAAPMPEPPPVIMATGDLLMVMCREIPNNVATDDGRKSKTLTSNVLKVQLSVKLSEPCIFDFLNSKRWILENVFYFRCCHRLNRPAEIA